MTIEHPGSTGRGAPPIEPYYQDEWATIYHGDARDVVPALGACADLVVTDPPYSLSVEQDHANLPGRGLRTLNFFAGDQDWDAMTATVLDVLALATMPERVCSVYVWCGHRQFGPIVQSLESSGWRTRFLVWAKKCPVPAPPGVGWNSGAELCVYGFRSGRVWTWETGSEPRSNVITTDSYRHGQPGKVDHPTQKRPVLMSLPIESSSLPEHVVLDPFMGSGTTLIAARQLGRRSIGIEIEERYCEVAVKRLAQGVLL